MEKYRINIVKTDPRAALPTYGSPFSAGADLYACTGKDVTVSPGETVLISTGLAMEIPEGYVGLVCARSGLATKRGLAPANKVGVIDSDYRGEILVSIFNHGPVPAVISHGERIAQLVITPVLSARFCVTDALSSTERGEGGFGSTGVK